MNATVFLSRNTHGTNDNLRDRGCWASRLVMGFRRGLGFSFLLALLASFGSVRAQEEPALPGVADLQVRSSADSTEIRLGLPEAVGFEDRTQARPGQVAVDEIRLFFPGISVERSRLVAIGDQIVEEARLFSETGGVTMTVVVRRPVRYTVERQGAILRVHLEPGILLAEGAKEVAPTPQAPLPVQPALPSRKRPAPGAGVSGQLQGQLAAPKISVPTLRAGEGLSVDAEHITYDEEQNQIVAKGHVTIGRAGSLLTADEVRINRETKIAEAIGNVQLTDPEGTIRSETFHVNLDDETGELTQSDVYFAANHSSISGSRFQKSYGQTYHIENGVFTTCQCGAGAPSWSISGREVDITLDGYGLVKGGTFRISDVPVFYLPLMSFPAKLSRQSGLLAPMLGYSKKRGITYTQPLYLVFNKSADATISADVESEARAGGIVEYRYALDKKSKGTLDFSFFDEAMRNHAERDIVDRNVADPTIPKERWSVTADAKQDLAYGVTGFADALAVSDDFFLREIPTFSFDPEYERNLRTSRFTQSRGGLYRMWDRATLIGQAIYYQDFIQEDDLTLQRLPQVSLFASNRYLDRHLKLRFQGEAVNFERKKGFDGPRLDVLPQAEVPFRWQEYFRGSAGVGYRETVYHLNDTDLLLPVSGAGGLQSPSETAEPPLATNPTRELYQATATIGTEVHRIFDVGGENVAKLKHTIEPGVDYLFVPSVNQDELPIYDATDRVTQRNLFTYGVTSRLLAKLRRAPRLVTQSYQPGELNAFSGASPAPFDDERTRTGFGPLEEAQRSSGGEEPPVEDLSPEARAAKEKEEEGVSNVIEWGRLMVAQSYDIDSRLREKSNDHFSDVDVGLRVQPVDSLALLFNSSVDARQADLTAAKAGLYLRDPRPRQPGGFLQSSQRAALGLSYRFISQSVLQEVDGALLLPFADSLAVFYQTRYDALQTQFLENRWGFRLSSQCQCWIIDLSVADRINPQETEVRMQVTLVGLGSVGRAR